MGTTPAWASIFDDFESDTSANYIVVGAGSPDYSANFQFDYIAAGIPLAPRSAIGDRFGLRFTANDTAGAGDAVTAFHNTPITASSYYLVVDVWMGVSGSVGTTEFTQVGVGGDGVTLNSLGTGSGSGSFFAMTGDGGSTRDYRWFADGNIAPGSDPSYQAGDNNSSDPYYQGIFPGGDFPGAPGNRWTTLRVDVSGSDLVFSLDGTPIVVGTATLTGDLISLGYEDVFSSIANPFQSQFAIYDNLSVKVVPVPAAGWLMLSGLLTLLAARRRHR